MPWLEASTRTTQFSQARSFLKDHKRWSRFPKTYQGYVKAIRRDDGQLTPQLWRHFQQQLPELARETWRWKSYVPLAVDGSRLECPRTPDNETALGCAGRKKTGPQVMLTTLYHLGTALPYAARVGPGTASEQRLLDDLLDDFPPRTLLLADAGFFSANLAYRLKSREHAFLLRVGGNKHLLTELFDEFEFGDGQQIWVWPDERQRNAQAPLSLRLIEIEAKKADQPNVFLLTNLPSEEMSDDEAEELYRGRWGVEVFFRGAKQTLESQTLKSRTPDLALAEAEWLVLSLFLLGSLTVREQPQGKPGLSRWSTAKTRDVVRQRIRNNLRCGGRWDKRLSRELRGCRVDEYQRSSTKRTRYYPQKKKERPPQPPKIRPASEKERQLAASLRV